MISGRDADISATVVSRGAKPDARSLIEVDSVSKIFSTPGHRDVQAIANVGFQVRAQSFVSIVGPSGCGKSTLLQVMAGLLQATSGQVRYAGQPVTGPPFDMIYIFQQYSKSLFPWKTVLGNVGFGLRHRERPTRPVLLERCRYYLDLVGLNGRETAYPWQLSGGMQQRLAIARALVCQPKVLLMDEPFSSVDALSRIELQDLVTRLWAELNITVVFVTHDIDEAVYMSQRVIVLSESPARIAQDLDVELAYPRDRVATREDPNFLSYRRLIFSSIFSRQSRAGG